jgi:hypothetical protein
MRRMLDGRSAPIQSWLVPDVDVTFNNENLKTRPAAFTEATVLIRQADASLRASA